jgi:hypothetical protein
MNLGPMRALRFSRSHGRSVVRIWSFELPSSLESPAAPSPALRVIGNSAFFLEQTFTSPRIASHIRRVQKPGDNDDPPGARGNDWREILQFNSADAKDRDLHHSMRFDDVRETDRLVIRLGRRGKEWTETDIISAFFSGRADLCKAMGRFSDEQSSPALLARLVNGKIILSHVDAVGTNRARNFWIIVDDQRHGAFRGHCSKVRRDGFQLRSGVLLAPKLQYVYAAIYHFAGHPDRFVWSDVGQIKNAVESAVAKRCQNYWSNRVGGVLNSKLPEFITRSTNPVS